MESSLGKIVFFLPFTVSRSYHKNQDYFIAGLLIFLTPRKEMNECVKVDPTLTFLRNEITRLIYRWTNKRLYLTYFEVFRYLKSQLKSCSKASTTTHHLIKLISDLHTSTDINFNKRIQLQLEDILLLLWWFLLL